MATKTIELTGIGLVSLVKRAGSRSLRLSVNGGMVRVSLPAWSSFKAAEQFAVHHSAWIEKELAKQATAPLESGQRIGKLHYLRFEQVLGGQSITSRVTGTEVVVRMQHGETIGDPQVQARAYKAALRALKREAEQLLPARLQGLAARHGRTYHSVSIKQLKRRWGSCDSHQAISLNLFLMELPWDYIDYVLLHELAHTIEMNHGPAFWRLLCSMEPNAKMFGKILRTHQPVIGNWHP